MKTIPMNTRFQKIILFTLLMMGSVACQTFRDIEIPVRPDMLVINGLFPVDSVLQIDVSHSNFILKKAYEEDISVVNATVEVYEQETPVGELKLVEDEASGGRSRSIYRSEAGFVPKENTEYTIKVAAPGYTSVSATCYVPQAVAISDFQFEKQEVVVGQDYRGNPSSIRIQDEKGVKNYYRLEVYAIVESTYIDGDQERTETHSSWLEVAPKVQDEQKIFDNYPFKLGLYTDDLAFDGKDYTFNFFINATGLKYLFWHDDSSQKKVRLRVLLKHISKEHYEYATSAEKQQDLLDDPFSEPIPATSNVLGGLGVFAGYSASIAEVDYDE